ncbi:MAG: sulfite exporter TauE/SafE family protein [archaeon]|nr:sulfite exporter TauE/SafE family protein [archaeon]
MEIELYLIIALIFTGLAVSFICSMIGLGGGVLFIPILILIYGISPQDAVGTSIFAMTMVTLSASIGYARNKCIDWKLAVAYDIFDIPGIIVGAIVSTLLPESILSIICGVAICIVACLVIFRKPSDHSVKNTSIVENSQIEGNSGSKSIKTNSILIKKNTDIDYSSTWKGKKFKWVVISSFFGGLVTGMVGMGGGTVDTTAMLIMGVPSHIAFGSSELAMLLTNAVGFTSHSMLGNVLWEFALPLGIASLIGAQIGSQLSPKINGQILKKILGIIALFTGIRLLIFL